ncbi:hypothetical protein HWC99_gp53 [Flavobacterium phage vB_FspS_tant8-1]|uniref:Uncharacterized protein n=1 Tax=Flavobacterium phage vB_FspS_tant8-1 TaxID=2686278 RepID=A0A6B9LV53_9CAUD|nr:hypothetical protein HWC99_gp53 [Flavobacterium phage vB_FspS_tant8-1]QHB40984.1 hypothetical protein tant81_gp053 [Flavobacterium phage vB_FspS_tant8-1]
MSVKIKKREYSEIYTTGKTDWLLANVGDWQKLNIEVEVAVEIIVTDSNSIEINNTLKTIKLSNGKSFGDYGFDNGMLVKLRGVATNDDFPDGTIIEGEFTILNVYDDVIEVDTLEINSINPDPMVFTQFTTGFKPFEDGSESLKDILIYSDIEPEGCVTSYCHLTNEDFDTTQLKSFIDQTTPEMNCEGINTLPVGTWKDFELTGYQSGMAIRKSKIRKIISSTQNAETIYLKNETFETMRLKIDEPGNRVAKPMKFVGTNLQNDFKNVTSNIYIVRSVILGSYVTTQTSNCFLHDASQNDARDIFFNVSFRITNSQPGLFGISDFVSLVLLRFNGNTFFSRTELKKWTNTRSRLNQILNFSEIVNVNILDGESYVLAFEYNNNTNSTYIDLKVEQAEIQTELQAIFPTTHKRFYELEIDFMIPSIFETLSNLENLEIPEYLNGDGSLTDNLKLVFYPEWNNPNTKIQNDLNQTKRLGNTGWFNENFNELPNDFSVDSVEYFDELGNVVSSIDYANKTKVKVIISGVQNLGSTTECGFGFAWIPTDENDFKNKTTSFHKNLFINSGDTENGFVLDTLFPGLFYGFGIGNATMNVKDVKFTKVGDKIVFESMFVPTPEFFSIFDSKVSTDRKFILFVSVADGTLVRNFSNRVTLLCDLNDMVKSIPPAGKYEYLDNAFVEHPFSETNVGELVYDGIVQDDLLCRVPFRIPKDGSIVFQKMKFGFDVFNLSTGFSFELEKYEVDLISLPIDSSGVQQFNINQTRGFKLENGNNKNWVKIKNEPTMNTSDLNGYLAYFATKIRWEDWIRRTDVPGIFFDALKANNGFNNDWFDFSTNNGFKVNFFVQIDALENNELKQFTNRFEIKLKDYDQNENIATEHKFFRDSDNTLLNIGADPETGKPLGVVLSNEPTRIEITFEILDGGNWDLLNTYGVTTIEVDKGAGRFEQRQLSSVWGSENDNPLKPIAGETKLKLEVDGTFKFLTTKCLVDPELLQPGDKYRITGRVGCYDQSGDDGFDPGLYEFRYENIYE